MGMFGSASQGTTEKKMADENAELIWRQMVYEQKKSKEDEALFRENVDALKSAQKAKIGASGVRSEDSPIEAILKTESDAQRAIEQKRYWDKIGLYEQNKARRITYSAGNYALVNGMMSAGGKGASYAGNIYSATQKSGDAGMFDSGGWGWSLLG